MRLGLFISFFVLWVSSYSQEPASVDISGRYKLPYIEFYDILEDENGVIWLTSHDGLYSFDGVHFKHIPNPNGKGISLFRLSIDYENRVWCCNMFGQYFFVENDELVLFYDDSNRAKGLKTFSVVRDELLIVDESILLAIHLSTKKTRIITPYTREQKPISLNITKPLSVGEVTYFAAEKGIVRLTDSGMVYVHESDTLLSPHRSTFVFLYADNPYFVYRESSLNHIRSGFSSSQDITLPPALQKAVIYSIVSEGNTLWFCTSNGVFCSTLKGNSIDLFDHLIPGEISSDVLLDRNKNLWIATLKKGVILIPNMHIKRWKPTDYNITCVYKLSDTSYFFGTADGKVVLATEAQGIVREIDLNNSKKVYKLVYDSELQILYSSQMNNFVRIDLRTYKQDEMSTFLLGKDLSLIQSGKLAVATTHGVFIATLNPETDQWEKTPVSSSVCYKTTYNPYDKKVYSSYAEGLFSYDSNLSASEIRYRNEKIFALDMAHTLDGILWVSTLNKGILGIRNNQVVRRFSAEQGLVSDGIKTLTTEGNTLWMVLNIGVQKWDSKTGISQVWYYSDDQIANISGIEVLQNSVICTSNMGVYTLSKESMFKPAREYTVSIDDIQVNNDVLLPELRHSLTYQQNRIKINFNSIGYYPKVKLRYQYRLIGLDTTWFSTLSDIHFAEYESLPPGDYVFQVFCNTPESNSPTQNITEIDFTISKPYWREYWFYGLSFLLFSALFYLIIRVVLQQKEKKILVENIMAENEITSLSLENLRSQMNPHFIFNSLNSIQEYIINNDKSKASSYLVKFSRLIRIYLNQSSDSTITLKEEIEALDFYLQLEKMRLNNLLNYEIKNGDGVDIHQRIIPSVFIQPYVENAIKHGLRHKKENLQLTIRFDLDAAKEYLVCCIEDNGIGIHASKIKNESKAKYHRPFATRANQKRLDLLNKRNSRKTTVAIENLLDPTGKSRGTRVTIKLPM